MPNPESAGSSSGEDADVQEARLFVQSLFPEAYVYNKPLGSIRVYSGPNPGDHNALSGTFATYREAWMDAYRRYPPTDAPRREVELPPAYVQGDDDMRAHVLKAANFCYMGLTGWELAAVRERQLRAAHARIASLTAQHEDFKRAARRLLSGNKYLAWESSGGPDECAHGYADGILCRHCDRLLVEGPQDSPESCGVTAQLQESATMKPEARNDG